MKKVFYAGSFNPFTVGHADIVKRLLKLSENVIIGIGKNADKKHICSDFADSNRNISRWITSNNLQDKVKVVYYDGLTAREAQNQGADCLARGVRNALDFEYEFSLAAANRDAFGIETILVPSDPSLSFISSSLIRDLESHGQNETASKYLPE